MRKKLPQDEYPTQAKRREIKKRPRMRMRGAGLKKLTGREGRLILKRTPP